MFRVYDNGGKTADRYTSVYSRHYMEVDGVRIYGYRCMSAHPSTPQGIGIWGESEGFSIDIRGGRHLGKRVAFEAVPETVQSLILSDLKDLYPTLKVS